MLDKTKREPPTYEEMGFLYSDFWFKVLSFTCTNKTHKAHGKPLQILK